MVCKSAEFLTEVTRLLEDLSSSVDDVAEDFRLKDCPLGVAIFYLSVVRETQCVQSMSPSPSLRVRRVRYSI